MTRKLTALLLAALLFCLPFCLASCNQEETNSETPAPEVEKPNPLANKAPETLDVNGDGAIKILSFGNSFSVNTYKYLHPILTAYGVENVTLGNLYQPSCTLETTYNFLSGNGVYASYYKYDTTGARTETKNYDAMTALTEENWDIITMQQASGFSGVPVRYTPYLDQIVEIIKENRTVKEGLLMWHMTWAYQANYVNDTYDKYYDGDQKTMFRDITTTVKSMIVKNENFSMVIPAGTAIQNARTSSLGDVMTKDGFHLNDRACFIAGYAWYTALTGEKLTEIKYVPDGIGLDDTWISVAMDAANAILDKPFAVTELDK